MLDLLPHFGGLVAKRSRNLQLVVAPKFFKYSLQVAKIISKLPRKVKNLNVPKNAKNLFPKFLGSIRYLQHFIHKKLQNFFEKYSQNFWETYSYFQNFKEGFPNVQKSFEIFWKIYNPSLWNQCYAKSWSWRDAEHLLTS